MVEGNGCPCVAFGTGETPVLMTSCVCPIRPLIISGSHRLGRALYYHLLPSKAAAVNAQSRLHRYLDEQDIQIHPSSGIG